MNDEAGNDLLDPKRGPVERCQSVIAHYTKHGSTRGDFNLDDVQWLIDQIAAKEMALITIRATTMRYDPSFNVNNIRSLCNAALPAGSDPAVKQMLPDRWAELRAIRAAQKGRWEAVDNDVPCRKCNVARRIQMRDATSSCGAYADLEYCCNECGHRWYYEGGDS